MSRRKIEIPDSLELLLDTICNTFGAVIFISMLLSILAEEKAAESEAPDNASQIDQMVTRLEQDVVKARAQHRQIKAQLDQQSDLLNRFSNPDALQMAHQIAQASETRIRVMTSRTDQLETLKDQEAESLRKEVILSEQHDLHDRMQRQVEAMARQLEVATAKVGRKAKISRIRPTSKLGFAYMLHNNRFYRTMTTVGEIDSADCSEHEEAGMKTIVPRPTGGLALPADMNRIQARLESLNNERHFVRLFVSPNSFGEFIAVKDAMVEQGLEYEVIILNDGEAKLYLSSEPIESFVQ
ncbi:MAG: hypothetical protein JNL58_23625 [Planctomyces sp.]|nr:hypothetical protein [Planctomyces sp.]